MRKRFEGEDTDANADEAENEIKKRKKK